MFKKKNQDNSLLVKETQYRAVITYLRDKQGFRVSVQRMTDVDEWMKVRCGLKGVTFPTKEMAERVARDKIKEQKLLDSKERDSANSYIIYDD